MMKILIAFDDSEYARAAIDDLRRAGLPRDATAAVISVVDTFLPGAALAVDPMAGVAGSHRVAGTLMQARAETELATEEAGSLAREGIKRVLSHFPEWQVFAHPVVGTAAHAIVQKAEAWPAHLVVLGSHGRSALGRLVLGSVSKHVASETSQSVRIARHIVTKGDAPVRVIVGVDGSPGADAAVRAVASRQWPSGTEMRVANVDDTVRPTGTVKLVPSAAELISEINDQQLAKMRTMVDRATDMLLGTGLQVSMHVAKGNPRDVLNEEARMWEADCIFVGARGLTTDGTRGKTGLGSVAAGLVSSAPCAVEITRS